ncbi:MAG: hypothetical protein LLG13_12875 [Bacteroidales bacterium]|nr:hypothetical protein [Bacteroidales bacterium]
MSFKVLYFFNKIGDIFPIGGGAAGAISQVNKLSYLPSWETVVSSLIITIIGATVGYLVKIGWDLAFYKWKKRHGI